MLCKKIPFHQDNAPCHKSLKTMAKLYELGFELLPHSPYSPDLAPSDYWPFAQLKKWLAGRKFHSNNEVITECETYFEGQDKSFYRKGIQMLERRWTDCITLQVMMNKNNFWKKKFFLHLPWDLLTDVLLLLFRFTYYYHS